MARNASGTYTLPSGNPVVSGTLIDATWANNTLSDLGNEMTDSLSRSGEGAMLAPLRITDGVQATPSLAFSNEPSSGLYRAGSNEWWAVAAGVQNLRFTNLGLTTRAAAGAVGTPSIAAFNDTDTGIYFPGANELAIATGGAARMTFDSAGAVAVPGTFTLSGGTANGVLYLNGSKVATSGSALTFNGSNLSVASGNLFVPSGVVAVGDTASGKYLEIYNGTADAQRIKLSMSGTDGVFQVTRSSGTVPNFIFQQDSTELMRLTSTGLGIGTASPGYRLDVSGTGRVTTEIRVKNSAGNVSYLTFEENGNGNSATFISGDARTTGNMGFWTNSAERMRLTSVGDLGIGTTSPAARLDVTGTFNGLQSRFGFTAGRGLEISTAAVGGTNEAASILNAKGSGSGALVIQTDSTDRLRVDNNGNVGAGTTGTISNRLQVECASGADRDIFLAGVTGASNGFYVQWNHATTKTHVRIANIPTSSAGLPSGTLWNDAGTIKIA